MSIGGDPIKNALITIATTLSASALIAVSSMYTDVQLLKDRSKQQEELSRVVQNLDKQVALNIQAVESLNRVVSKLSDNLENSHKTRGLK